MKDDTQPCRFLEWDSEFFNLRIAALTPHRLTPIILNQLEQYRRTKDIDLIYFFADPNDPSTVALAESSGFQLVDVQVTYEGDASNYLSKLDKPRGLDIRAHGLSDIDSLAVIAQKSHLDTRFFNDPHFTIQQTESLYKKWIENSCAGWADKVFTAEFYGKIAGYITCHLDRDNKVGKIGLLGVESTFRSKRIGQNLLLHGLKWLADQEMETITLTTRAGNIAAQRLYQRSALVIKETFLTYHAWF